jgi:predicted heme/steroid binding protein
MAGKQIDPEGENIVGRVFHKRHVIGLLRGTDYRYSNQTLWHEALHVVAYQRNIELSENAIDSLAFGIIELLEANGLSADLT